METIVRYLLTVPAALITIMLHELAHGVTANRLGDPTARAMGRLTLNPLKHLDPLGAVCMVLFRFGWAKPVPVNPRYFKDPKRGMALTALAGPLANIFLAFLTVPLVLWTRSGFISLLISGAGEGFLANFLEMLWTFLSIFHYLNLGLALFNLIPLPPLDGSRILFAFLPEHAYFSVMRYERYISLALILFLLLGANFGFLDTLADAISGVMVSVWRLLPIF